MYLTKVVLNVKKAAVARSLAFCGNGGHQLIWGFFDDDIPEPRPRILYRLLGNTLYILSSIAPVPKLDRSYYLELQTKEFNPRFENNSKLYLDMVANPTPPDSHIAILNKKQQEEWLVAQGTKFGFIVDHVEVGGYRRMKINNKENEFSIFAVPYMAHITITDAEKFYRVFCNGMGRAKAYGMGMLMVRK